MNTECSVMSPLDIHMAKARLAEMRSRELSADERLEAHALANQITQAMLRAYFAAEVCAPALELAQGVMG